MARKSKRMALYEAIRQGQVKIAKGLESGQMRSDGRPPEKAANRVTDNRTLLRSKGKPLHPSVPFNKKWLTIVKNVQTRPRFSFGHFKQRIVIPSPFHNKWSAAVVLTAVGVLILALLVWSSLDVGGTGESIPTAKKQQPAVAPAAEKTETSVKEAAGSSGISQKKTTEKPEVKKEPPSTMPAGGPNVIVIQSITAGRRDELNVLQDFFAAKGIETEIIIDRNGYAILVTKQGFTDNPESSGTDGYRLLQKIQQLGRLYPEETKDTKFGLKPFQDAYGYKR